MQYVQYVRVVMTRDLCDLRGRGRGYAICDMRLRGGRVDVP